VLARAGVAQTLIPRTLQSLQLLDLVNPETGAPTPTFEAMRRAPETEYRARLEEWLKGTYADVFSFVDPLKDDDTRIRDAFRNYEPLGQQARMVGLFLALCGAAGLRPKKQKQAAPRQADSRPRSPAPSIQRRAAQPKHPSIRAGRGSSSRLPPAISGLLESLPSVEDGWTTAERDKFLTTLKAVLDFCIPIITRKQSSEAAE
jgi:hypothetical protein